MIVNPKSGTRRKEGLDTMVRSILSPDGVGLDVVPTRYAGHASELAIEAVKEGYDAIVAAGGDGTVNEVASSLCGTGVPLGIIPCGSGNGLARSLGIPNDFEGAVKYMQNSRVTDMDHGIISGHPFFCTCGVGFDAAVSMKFATSKKRGRSSYIRSVLKEFVEYNPEPYAIAIDGKILTERAFLIAVCNAPQYGNNAYIAPNARLTDGMLDITVVHSGSSLATALVGVDLFTGNLDRNTQIETFRVPSAIITRLNPGPAHIDGEPMELGSCLKVECHPANLTVLASELDTQFRPFISPLKEFITDLHYDIKANLRFFGNGG